MLRLRPLLAGARTQAAAASAASSTAAAVAAAAGGAWRFPLPRRRTHEHTRCICWSFHPLTNTSWTWHAICKAVVRRTIH